MSKISANPSIIVTDLTFETRPGSVLFKNLSISFGTEKSGLVGKNGTGKTILLRSIIGEIEPTGGHIERRSKIAYLPQDYQLHPNQSVGDALGITEKLRAIQRVTDGEKLDELLNSIDQDWDIADRAKKALARFGLSKIDFYLPLVSLSGGERMKVILARLMIGDADFIILDEPTNNLDQDSRRAVYELIDSWPGGLLVVSHDRELLSHVDRIIELSEKGLKVYGGNYDAYTEQKSLENEALERQLSDAERELGKIHKQAQSTKEKQQKRASHGKSIREKTGMSAIILGKMKETSENTSSRLSALHESRIEDAVNNVAQARERISPSNAIHVDLSNTEIPAGKLVVTMKDVAFEYVDMGKRVFEGLSFDVHGPSRVSIDGPNGSGKTTLIKLMLGQLQPTKGEVRRGEISAAYLDQAVAILDQEKTVLENLRNISGLDEANARHWLGRFLFSDQEVFKVVRVLSGGERMRTALACILAGEAPPKLLVLDEPTNNLDLDSIEQIESALLNFKGALIVISHDREFIKNIGVDRSIELS